MELHQRGAGVAALGFEPLTQGMIKAILLTAQMLAHCTQNLLYVITAVFNFYFAAL